MLPGLTVLVVHIEFGHRYPVREVGLLDDRACVCAHVCALVVCAHVCALVERLSLFVLLNKSVLHALTTQAEQGRTHGMCTLRSTRGSSCGSVCRVVRGRLECLTNRMIESPSPRVWAAMLAGHDAVVLPQPHVACSPCSASCPSPTKRGATFP